MEDFFRDIICQVLVDYKSKELIYSVLNEFIPNYEKLNLDYAAKPDDENYLFQSEDEMISYFTNTPNVSQTFYWNQPIENPDKIMVGANITIDNQIVFSLTFNGTDETEGKYLLQLKKTLNSNISVISYVIPAEYESGNDFKQRYEHHT
jgi:hypothetical protein